MGDESSLMDDLAAAWDEAEAEQETTEVAEETVEAAPEEIVSEAPLGEEAGDGDSPHDTAAEPAEPQLEDSAGVSETPIETAEAPKGLSPAAREVWNDVPEAVKADIAKREQDFERGIQKYAEAAKRADGMDRALAPFGQLMSMNGGPQNVLPGLLQTASQLQFGTPQQKAGMVANLIKQFGVDIQALDHILVGEQPPEGQPPQQNIQEQINQAVQQAMAPMYQQQQAGQQQRIASEIDEFAQKAEFWGDVQGDVADIMEISANQGRQVSLEEAYNRACMMRDDIRQILDARKSQQAVQQRKPAAVSVSGAPSGDTAPPAPQTIAEHLSAAWDAVDNARSR